MKKDDHHLAGSLLKTTGIKGEIVLKFNDDCPEEFQELESIFIDVDNKLVPFFIENIRFKSNNTAVVKFEDLDDEADSLEFIGSAFYLTPRQADLIEMESEDFIDVEGYQVFDQNGNFLGEVLEFIDIPENPLLNIKTDKREILIPAKDELIIDLDDEAREIRIFISEGLTELD